MSGITALVWIIAILVGIPVIAVVLIVLIALIVGAVISRDLWKSIFK